MSYLDHVSELLELFQGCLRTAQLHEQRAKKKELRQKLFQQIDEQTASTHKKVLSNIEQIELVDKLIEDFQREIDCLGGMQILSKEGQKTAKDILKKLKLQREKIVQEKRNL